MQPVFRIEADGKDITALINDRLLLLRTTDKPGMESDDFELRIDERDGAVALPAISPPTAIQLSTSRVFIFTLSIMPLSGSGAGTFTPMPPRTRRQASLPCFWRW